MPLNPTKSELHYWNKKIALVDDQKMDPSLGPIKIGKNSYYGRKLSYSGKVGIVFKKIIPTIFISVVLAPIAIPSLFAFTDVYRHLIRWIKEVHYGRKLKCINNVAKKKFIVPSNSTESSSSTSSSGSSPDTKKVLATLDSNNTPLEVLRLIFSNGPQFPNSEKIKEHLRTLSLVCKAWRSQVEGAKIDLINKGVNLEYFPKMGRRSQMFGYIKANANSLHHLYLGKSQFSKEEIKSLSECCPKLQSLEIKGKLITKDIAGFKEMKKLVISSANIIKKEALNFPLLEELTIQYCWISDLPSFENLPKLKKLSLLGNDNIKTIPSLDHLPELEFLKICHNASLNSISSLNLSKLESLEITLNNSLHNIPSLNNLSQLKELIITRNKILMAPPSFDQLFQLEEICFMDNPLLTYLPSFANLKELTHLHISSCPILSNIPSYEHLHNLKDLFIVNNDSLQTIPSFSNLVKLRRLDVSDNKSLQFIPSLSTLVNLKRLIISDNPSLEKLPSIEGLNLLDRTSIKFYKMDLKQINPPLKD